MKVIIEAINAPEIWKEGGSAATLRIEAIEGFTTSGGQFVLPSNGNKFYLEVAISIVAGVPTIPSIEIDSTDDANPWSNDTIGNVAGYRVSIITNKGKSIPYFTGRIPVLASGDTSFTWGELRIANTRQARRFIPEQLIRESQARQWIQEAVGDRSKASETNIAHTALDTDPLDPTFPIAVGVNSPLLNQATVVINAISNGVVANAGVIEDAAITTGTTVLNSPGSNFSSELTGLTVVVAGAGVGGASLTATIVGVPSTTSLTLSAPASTTVAASRAVYGTDNTTALQTVLDSAPAAAFKSVVYLPKGNYLFASGSLNVPQGVQLQGSWTSAPDHMGYRYTDEAKPMAGDGTTLVVTAGEGVSTGQFIFLNSQASLRGVCLFHPMQMSSLAAPKLYPWAIEMFAAGPVVEHVELVNPYQGIYSHIGQRHRVRDVKGQPLSIGLYASQQLESSIYSDIDFVPIYSFATLPEASPYPMTPLNQWIHQHGTAFKIGRVDNAMFVNCFTFSYFKGFKFVVDAAEVTSFANGSGAPGGKAWAEFVNCGADTCPYPVDVDDVQGVDATGAVGVTFDACIFAASQWFAFAGPELFSIFCRNTFTGRVGLVNCRFHLCNVAIVNQATAGSLSVVGCFFQDWTVNAININGTATIVGSTFKFGSTGPVIVSTASGANAAWLSVVGNQFQYLDNLVYNVHADANFNEAGNSYADGPKNVAVTYQNGWVDFGAGFQGVSYIREDRWLTLRGTAKSGTVALGTPVFTLPAGFRPAAGLLFPVQSNSVFGIVSVASSGVVSIALGNNASVSFDGIRFAIR